MYLSVFVCGNYIDAWGWYNRDKIRKNERMFFDACIVKSIKSTCFLQRVKLNIYFMCYKNELQLTAVQKKTSEIKKKNDEEEIHRLWHFGHPLSKWHGIKKFVMKSLSFLWSSSVSVIKCIYYVFFCSKKCTPLFNTWWWFSISQKWKSHLVFSI